MPRPLTPTDPPESHHLRFLRFGFRHVNNVAICFFPTLTGLNVLQGVRPPLWPICFPVYASCYCYQFPRNTRYGWLARPYPTGTSTRQECAKLAWRSNIPRVCEVPSASEALARRLKAGAAKLLDARQVVPNSQFKKLLKYKSLQSKNWIFNIPFNTYNFLELCN